MSQGSVPFLMPPGLYSTSLGGTFAPSDVLIQPMDPWRPEVSFPEMVDSDEQQTVALLLSVVLVPYWSIGAQPVSICCAALRFDLRRDCDPL